MNWGNIMKNINENPYEFFKEGGWGFLGGTAVGEAGSDASDASSEESEFEMEEDDDASSESAASESDDYSEDSAASESGSEAFSDDESGEDWDELERKAAKCGCPAVLDQFGFMD